MYNISIYLYNPTQTKTQFTMTTVEVVANHIRQHYSAHGAEVGAVGQRSVTVSLPQEMPITQLVADMWNTFGATTDIKHAHHASGASLVVWLSTTELQHVDDYSYKTSSSISWLSAVAIAASGAVAAYCTRTMPLTNHVVLPLNISDWIIF